MSFEFPLSVMLVPYGIIFLYVLFFALMNLQHLFHYGTSVGTAKTAAWVWFLGTLAILCITFITLRNTDWGYQVSISPPAYTSESSSTSTDFGL